MTHSDRAHALRRLELPGWQHRAAATAPAADLGVRYHAATFGVDLAFRSNGPDLDGTFSGYGSLHGITDSYGTRMMPGCWRAGGLDDRPYALLWMHNPEVVLGTFRAREDERGLWIEGQYDATDVGQRARAQAQSGSAPELSVGFVQLSTLEDDSMALTATRLVEVSQITARMAATPGAALSAVRSAADALMAPPAAGLEQRVYAELAGSFEERQRALAATVNAWALEQYGERAEDNDWWASVEATFTDSVVFRVTRWTPAREDLLFRATTDGDSLQDVAPVDVTATVTARSATAVAAAARARLALAL